ncbi:DJ-1/PfpI family protein [Oceanimonas sp. NS1]|nr:DJ-1/PfpI family protein [Oceanimonas sp. NS1]
MVAFVLYPGFVGLDVSGPLEVFNTASILSRAPNARYRFQFVAGSPGAVPSMAGLCMSADTGADECVPHTLVVPGGSPDLAFASDEGLVQMIRHLAGRSRRIVSVCTGSHLLAACGLLRHRKATTHWQSAALLARQYPETEVEADRIHVRDGNIMTSAGVTAGIDMALALVEEDMGPKVALEVARQLVLYRCRPGHQSQFSAPLQAQQRTVWHFAGLHRWLERQLHTEISVEQMAAQVGMSPRHFSRRFRQEAGMSPGRYLEQLRLDRARELLESGESRLKVIAAHCGLERSERLRKAFLRRFGVTPSQYQAHFIHEDVK